MGYLSHKAMPLKTQINRLNGGWGLGAVDVKKGIVPKHHALFGTQTVLMPTIFADFAPISKQNFHLKQCF